MREAGDWDARYRQGEHPWDHGEASPGLQDFLCSTPPEAVTACVPGCGFGHDARCLARHGYRTIGLDISPTAIRLAAESGGESGARFRVGDFLRESPESPFDLVFEHTLYCAIEPADRDRYVRAVRRWLRPGGLYLANYYLIREEDGPPHPSTREEILGRFSPWFHLHREWVPRSWPHRADLEWMVLWELRPGDDRSLPGA